MQFYFIFWCSQEIVESQVLEFEQDWCIVTRPENREICSNLRHTMEIKIPELKSPVFYVQRWSYRGEKFIYIANFCFGDVGAAQLFIRPTRFPDGGCSTNTVNIAIKGAGVYTGCNKIKEVVGTLTSSKRWKWCTPHHAIISPQDCKT